MNDYKESSCWDAYGTEKVSQKCGMPKGCKLYSEKLGITIIVCSHFSGGKNQKLALDLMEIAEIELDIDRKKREYLGRFPDGV